VTDVKNVDEVREALAAHDYLADEGLATAIFLALRLERPLLLEGEAGVGKTEVAKVLARWTGGELVRLQCYEGIDAAQAVYDWDYSRQLLHLRAAEATGEARGLDTGALEEQLYQERFLLKRALLRAIDHHHPTPPILLIDEVDRADDEFEAYLLEVLSDYEITVPELLLKQAQRTKNIFNVVLGSIASISLIVGGIGIMNIMLASVLERIREIGVRRAIGATQRDILFQFLCEAVLISVAGGVAGILIGVGLSIGIERVAGITTMVSPLSVLVAFGVSFSVGLGFGIVPAYRAARQDPVVCLRYE